MRIVPGVTLHSLGQRTQGPIGFLRTLLQFDAEVFLDQVAEPKLPQAKQARGQHGIEDGAGHELVVLAQEPQVVVRAVHDQFVAGQGIKQRVEVKTGQRINEPVTGEGADLDQADLFRVGMQAVCLGVHRHPVCRAEDRQVAGKVRFTIYHAGNIFRRPLRSHR